MSYQIVRLLEPEEAERVVVWLGGREFADGKLTAHGHAREVKNNLQIERTGPEPSAIDGVLIAAFQRSQDFQAFTIPKRVLLPTYSRYEPGMEYGAHVDNSLMGGINGSDRIRTDYSVTVFLSPPQSYDGGELVLKLPHAQEEIKLQAGEAIVYPSSSIHYVAKVTRGVRLAAVTWVQSMVRDERLRAILWDLARMTQSSKLQHDHELMTGLGQTYHNILRYAAEP